MKPTIIAETKDERGNVTRRLTTKGQRFRNYCRDCGKPTTGWFSDPMAMVRKKLMVYLCFDCKMKQDATQGVIDG